MKNRLLVLVIALCSLFSTYAQKDVTQFMGIPVDGSKKEMIKALKDKGFKKNPDSKNTLIGMFNGTKVVLDVHEQKNKVYRIIIRSAIPMSLSNAVNRFNHLCEKFENSNKYISINDWSIPSIEAAESAKEEYQAVFFQYPSEIGDSILRKQTFYDYVTQNIDQMYKNEISEEARGEKIEELYLKNMKELCEKKRVWFTLKKYNQIPEY
ncbi:MAG: hypothetical protein K2I24_00780, partial [Duncaniella sp.]|nr:hypothetical protein [Duncaniella sp.]